MTKDCPFSKRSTSQLRFLAEFWRFFDLRFALSLMPPQRKVLAIVIDFSIILSVRFDDIIVPSKAMGRVRGKEAEQRRRLRDD
jgi:hypothetical protein